jgi:hypothetical protein
LQNDIQVGCCEIRESKTLLFEKVIGASPPRNGTWRISGRRNTISQWQLYWPELHQNRQTQQHYYYYLLLSARHVVVVDDDDDDVDAVNWECSKSVKPQLTSRTVTHKNRILAPAPPGQLNKPAATSLFLILY